jgi:hypothetical protein
MGDESQSVLGLDLGYKVLADSEIALEVLACVKYFNADGEMDYHVFDSSGLCAVEAYGMAALLELKCKADLEVAMIEGVSRDDRR